jgi:hypothetical protein
MGKVDEDRVDPRTGTMRAWTQRVRRVETERVRDSSSSMRTLFGLKRGRVSDLAASEWI